MARNEIYDNDRFCGPEGGHEHDGDEDGEYQRAQQAQPQEQAQEEEEPTVSGAGIILWGARNVRVAHNNV